MVNIDNYICQLTDLLVRRFESRLAYVGLQGSYLRGEATCNSDIDIMVIIDNLTVYDLDNYRSIIQSMDHFDKSCGFICSTSDIANWNPLEICHLLNSTKDYLGKLREFVPQYSKDDVRNFIKLSINNLYHEICHRYIHADYNLNIAQLASAYKGVFFILQNLYYLNNDKYISTKSELLAVLKGKDRDVLECSIAMNKSSPLDFLECFTLLFTWCQETLESI